jgi:hypothetical protein
VDLSTIITAAATIAAPFFIYIFAKFLKSESRKRLSKIRVKRINHENDPDLEKALDFYCDADFIPANERDDRGEIVRWIREIRDETEQGIAALIDYFLIAKGKGNICGILYAHYYLKSKMLFISYLIASTKYSERKDKIRGISSELLRYIKKRFKKELKDCRGIVFELRLDKHFESKSALFSGFAQQLEIPIRRIMINYVQPKVSLWNGSGIEEMAIYYGRIGRIFDREYLPRGEVIEILDFLYDEIYGDQFSTIESKDRQYKDHLRELYNKTILQLPENVPIKEVRSIPIN